MGSVNTDYTAGQDTVKIKSGAVTKTTYSGTSVSYNLSGMIADDTAWFVEDDKNIASTETNIASILEVSADDYSMTSVTSALNYDSLISVQNENQLVYNKFDKK